MRVYCEHGALNERPRRLQTEGRITLVGFPTMILTAVVEQSEPWLLPQERRLVI
jgi:hypothetical protein